MGALLAFFLFLGFEGFGGGRSAHAAPGDDCPPVDIREGLSPALKDHFLLPRDQGDASLCVSFTLAELLSVELGEPVSPLDIGHVARSLGDYRPPRAGPESLVNGGPGTTPMSALNALHDRGKGVCPMPAMPAPHDYRQSPHGSFSDQMYELAVLQNMARLGYGPEEFRGFLEERGCDLGITSHINIPAHQIVAVLVRHKRLDLADILAALADLSCRERRIELPPELRVAVSSRPAKLHPRVDDLLQKGKPAGLLVDVRYFHARNDAAGGHAMTILGRRPQGGKCLYVVRNSWGYSCDAYKEPFRTHCALRAGTFLIAREQLDAWAEYVFYLEETRPPSDKPPGAASED